MYKSRLLFYLIMWLIILSLFLPPFPTSAAKWDTIRVSLANDGSEANGFSYKASLSPNGYYVAFWSYASNLVATDTNNAADVFLRDVFNNTTILVSVAFDGSQGNANSANPSVSYNGQYVAFESNASNLVPNDTNGVSDIFVRDVVNGTITRVSVDSSGNEGNLASNSPVISADGRYVAFESKASNLVPGDTNNQTDIFLHDLQTGQTTRISVATDGSQALCNSIPNCSISPSISGDGRYVAFASSAYNLVSDDTNNKQDIFVRDTVNNITMRVSVASDGSQGNNTSRHPSISAGGDYVVFDSLATNLVSGDSNGQADVFMRDVFAGTTSIVSLASDGSQITLPSTYPVVSEDGRYVAFMCSAPVIPGDQNGVSDIFLRDTTNNVTFRVSIASDGTQSDDASTYPSISWSGQFVAFASSARNLVPNDNNNAQDIFYHDVGNVYITAADTNPTNVSTVNYTVTFDEPVTEVDISDFSLTVTSGTLSGASITSITGSDTLYTVTADTGTGSGWLRLDIPASAVIKDQYGNPIGGFPYTRGESYNIDRTPPEVSSITRLDPNPTNEQNVDFLVSFSEPVMGVDASDFSLTFGGTLSGVTVTNVTGVNDTYTVTVDTGTGEGTLRLDIPDTATVTDRAGNSLSNLPYIGGEEYLVDEPPIVSSIVRADPNPTNATSVNFTVTFSEDVTGVDETDFNLTTSGTIVGPAVTGVSGSGSSYTITVNTGSGSGTLRLDVSDNDTIQDLSSNPLGGVGNGNGDYTNGESYDIDKDSPTVNIARLTPSSQVVESGYQVTYRVTFSEDVTGVETGDFILTLLSVPGSNASISSINQVSPSIYDVTVDVTGIRNTKNMRNGAIRLDIPNTAIIQDLVGNALSGLPYTDGEIYSIVEQQTFDDVVANSHPFWTWIERLFYMGISGGCDSNNFCPTASITRAQMAVFLLRGKYGYNYTPPAVGDSTGFNDVPVTHPFAAWIKQLAAEGITSGCGGGNYCPNQSVTRAQMAVFLLRAEHGGSYTPPPVGDSTGFEDVPVTHPLAAWIKQLVAEGITGGCGNGNYCPTDPVTRGQMAVFLIRTFNLP